MEQMIIRQRVLADFGDFALRSENLNEVLQEACRLVAKALNADLAKVLEIEEGGEAALVKAGVGWNPGIVGKERLMFSERSSEIYALERHEPVVSWDIKEENRFDFAEFLIDHGVVSLVNVPIFLPGGKAYGLLQVDSRELRKFDDRDTEFLRTYATILGPVIDRMYKLRSLEKALEVNEHLMQELQHRVKNHIGIVASLIRTRARQTKSEDVRNELAAVGERIGTLHLVNEQLYQTGTTNRLPLRPFLSQLIERLCKVYDCDISLEFDIADVDLPAATAVPIGLIANEFVTNSLKYAFDGKGGKILASAEEVGDILRLCLSDNGKGMSCAASSGTGTGLKLIDALASQLGCEATWPPSPNGTTLCLDLNWSHNSARGRA